MALTGGLLAFLMVDATLEGLELAGEGSQARPPSWRVDRRARLPRPGGRGPVRGRRGRDRTGDRDARAVAARRRGTRAASRGGDRHPWGDGVDVRDEPAGGHLMAAAERERPSEAIE